MKHLESGTKVNDLLVFDIMIEDYLKNKHDTDGLILDAFPKNQEQGELFISYFDISKCICVNIDINKDILIKRLSGRRVCPNCSRNYNIAEIYE